MHNDISLLHELDNVSKTHPSGNEDIDQVLINLAKQILPSLNIERMNVWLFNEEKNAIISVGEYDIRTKRFSKNTVLEAWKYPDYFHALRENKIIEAEYIRENPITAPFNEEYSIPLDIYSLLDVPLRVAGELAGVICFEKTGQKKVFSHNEKSFCLSVSFLIASLLETKYRRAAQANLEKLLLEKDTLLKELNHRTRNNLSILVSLLRISKNKTETGETKRVVEEYEQRVFSMLKIHDLLQQNHYFNQVHIAKYINELINEFRVSYPQFNHKIKANVHPIDFYLPSKSAIYLGLIITEVLLNAIKHATPENENFLLSIDFEAISDNKTSLVIHDNGPGFEFNSVQKTSSMGLGLIADLASAICLKTNYPKPGNSRYYFELSTEQ